MHTVFLILPHEYIMDGQTMTFVDYKMVYSVDTSSIASALVRPSFHERNLTTTTTTPKTSFNPCNPSRPPERNLRSITGFQILNDLLAGESLSLLIHLLSPILPGGCRTVLHLPTCPRSHSIIFQPSESLMVTVFSCHEEHQTRTHASASSSQLGSRMVPQTSDQSQRFATPAEYSTQTLTLSPRCAVSSTKHRKHISPCR